MTAEIEVTKAHSRYLTTTGEEHVTSFKLQEEYLKAEFALPFSW